MSGPVCDLALDSRFRGNDAGGGAMMQGEGQ
jgi:hypothetical protein